MTVNFSELKVERISEDAQLPYYATDGSSGMDLISCNDYTLNVNSRILVQTGIKCEIPHGMEAQIRPRSGLALKHGITVLNTPGTIDHDYSGEICVLLFNTSDSPFQIKKGDRVAQMVISPVVRLKINEVDSLTRETKRGEGGFGSTGS